MGTRRKVLAVTKMPSTTKILVFNKESFCTQGGVDHCVILVKNGRVNPTYKRNENETNKTSKLDYRKFHDGNGR